MAFKNTFMYLINLTVNLNVSIINLSIYIINYIELASNDYLLMHLSLSF